MLSCEICKIFENNICKPPLLLSHSHYSLTYGSTRMYLDISKHCHSLCLFFMVVVELANTSAKSFYAFVGWRWCVSFNVLMLIHLFPMHPFSILWKRQKTLRFFDVFRILRKDALGTNGLIQKNASIIDFKQTNFGWVALHNGWLMKDQGTCPRSL